MLLNANIMISFKCMGNIKSSPILPTFQDIEIDLGLIKQLQPGIHLERKFARKLM